MREQEAGKRWKMREKTGWNKKFVVILAAMVTVIFCAACGNRTEADKHAETSGTDKDTETSGTDKDTKTSATDKDTGDADKTEIQVFIAASLQNVMAQLAEDYYKQHPNVKIAYHAESSGTLLTQIQEGYACDIFFSAAQKQMDQLEKDGLVVEGTRTDVVRNQVVVIAGKGSGTKVTGLSDLENAQSIALADGSVPVGRYTRQALVNLGKLKEADDAAAITTAEIQKTLGGTQVSEQGNVSKVLLAVVEGSCEVGTVYQTDLYGYEDELEILETVSYDLSGDVVYPAAQVVNEEADEAQSKAAAEFAAYLLSDEAKTVFEAFYYKPVT